MRERLSKNQRRKRRRARYRQALEDVAADPLNTQALATLQALFEKYYGLLDSCIDGLGAFPEETGSQDEWLFIRDLIRQWDENGWIVIPTEEGLCQIKADLSDYINRCRGTSDHTAHARADAAQSLRERAVHHIQPRHH